MVKLGIDQCNESRYKYKVIFTMHGHINYNFNLRGVVNIEAMPTRVNHGSDFVLEDMLQQLAIKDLDTSTWHSDLNSDMA